MGQLLIKPVVLFQEQQQLLRWSPVLCLTSRVVKKSMQCPLSPQGLLEFDLSMISCEADHTGEVTGPLSDSGSPPAGRAKQNTSLSGLLGDY